MAYPTRSCHRLVRHSPTLGGAIYCPHRIIIIIIILILILILILSETVQPSNLRTRILLVREIEDVGTGEA